MLVSYSLCQTSYETFNYYICMIKRGLISTSSAVQLIRRKEKADLPRLAFEAAWCNLKYRGVSDLTLKINACCIPVLMSPHESIGCHVRKHKNYSTLGGMFPFDELFY